MPPSVPSSDSVWPPTVTWLPPPPSRRALTASTTCPATVRPKRASHAFGIGSVLAIVPVASPSPINAPEGFDNVNVNVSSPSSLASSSNGTATVFSVSPAAKVSVPRGRGIVLAGLRRAVGGGVVHRRRPRRGPAQAHREVDGRVPAFLGLGVGDAEHRRSPHGRRHRVPQHLPVRRADRTAGAAGAAAAKRHRHVAVARGLDVDLAKRVASEHPPRPAHRAARHVEGLVAQDLVAHPRLRIEAHPEGEDARAVMLARHAPEHRRQHHRHPGPSRRSPACAPPRARR